MGRLRLGSSWAKPSFKGPDELQQQGIGKAAALVELRWLGGSHPISAAPTKGPCQHVALRRCLLIDTYDLHASVSSTESTAEAEPYPAAKKKKCFGEAEAYTHTMQQPKKKSRHATSVRQGHSGS